MNLRGFVTSRSVLRHISHFYSLDGNRNKKKRSKNKIYIGNLLKYDLNLYIFLLVYVTQENYSA